ncbi:MAG TPA: ribonuclease T2 [Edaphobacter sp.]
MMRKRFLLPLSLLLPLLACNTGTQTAQPSSTPQPKAAQSRATTRPRAEAAIPAAANASFDYYLLNLSWSPEYCHSHPTANECSSHPAFVLHGLWPERNDGSYPEDCSNAPGPSDPSQYSDVYPDQGLLQHEWKTHGTCSGLAPDAYFNLARSAFRSITVPPELAGLTKQTSMTPAKILSIFTKANPSIQSDSLALSCGNNYLTAVEVCLDKQGKATSCGKLRSCRANAVRIPPPGRSN